MKVGVVRGATLKDVQAKKFNIYLGISLGNKWFTRENLKGQLLWALKYTKDRAGLLVGDTLHAINYETRNKKSPTSAKKLALRKGDELISILSGIIDELPIQDQKKIDIIRWDDVNNFFSGSNFLSFLYGQYKTDEHFRKEILKIVDLHLSEKDFSNEQKIKAGTYIIEELPELLHGFSYKGTFYECYTYPYDGLLNQLVEKIQSGELFPEFHKSLEIRDHVFVELR